MGVWTHPQEALCVARRVTKRRGEGEGTAGPTRIFRECFMTSNIFLTQINLAGISFLFELSSSWPVPPAPTALAAQLGALMLLLLTPPLSFLPSSIHPLPALFFLPSVTLPPASPTHPTSSLPLSLPLLCFPVYPSVSSTSFNYLFCPQSPPILFLPFPSPSFSPFTP